MAAPAERSLGPGVGRAAVANESPERGEPGLADDWLGRRVVVGWTACPSLAPGDVVL
jgi:hypothetical protein